MSADLLLAKSVTIQGKGECSISNPSDRRVALKIASPDGRLLAEPAWHSLASKEAFKLGLKSKVLTDVGKTTLQVFSFLATAEAVTPEAIEMRWHLLDKEKCTHCTIDVNLEKPAKVDSSEVLNPFASLSTGEGCVNPTAGLFSELNEKQTLFGSVEIGFSLKVWFLDGKTLFVPITPTSTFLHVNKHIEKSHMTGLEDHLSTVAIEDDGIISRIRLDGQVMMLVNSWSSDSCKRIVFAPAISFPSFGLDIAYSDADSVENVALRLVFGQACFQVLQWPVLIQPVQLVELVAFLLVGMRQGVSPKTWTKQLLRGDLEPLIGGTQLAKVDRSWLENGLIVHLEKLHTLTQLEARHGFVELVRSHPLFGSRFFGPVKCWKRTVVGDSQELSAAVEVDIAVNSDAVHIIYDMHSVESHQLHDIRRWASSIHQGKDLFMLCVTNSESEVEEPDKQIFFVTKHADELRCLLEAFVALIQQFDEAEEDPEESTSFFPEAVPPPPAVQPELPELPVSPPRPMGKKARRRSLALRSFVNRTLPKPEEAPRKDVERSQSMDEAPKSPARPRSLGKRFMVRQRALSFLIDFAQNLRRKSETMGMDMAAMMARLSAKEEQK